MKAETRNKLETTLGLAEDLSMGLEDGSIESEDAFDLALAIVDNLKAIRREVEE